VSATFRFDRRFAFPVAPDELWRTLSHTERFPHWWSWLREIDGGGLREGAAARCVIRSPLPYTLRCTVTVEEAVEPALVATAVTGDLEGPARLEIAPDEQGSTARLAWSLELRDPALRRLAAVGRPLMAWAHDRVVATGLRQFERRALDARARS